jgi:hypothetical protein
VGLNNFMSEQCSHHVRHRGEVQGLGSFRSKQLGGTGIQVDSKVSQVCL